jgi:hypothetical protein
VWLGGPRSYGRTRSATGVGAAARAPDHLLCKPCCAGHGWDAKRHGWVVRGPGREAPSECAARGPGWAGTRSVTDGRCVGQDGKRHQSALRVDQVGLGRQPPPELAACDTNCAVVAGSALLCGQVVLLCWWTCAEVWSGLCCCALGSGLLSGRNCGAMQAELCCRPAGTVLPCRRTCAAVRP